MGIVALRAEANREAQKALRDLVTFYIKHPGRRHVLLEDTYRAAERVLDAIDEYESHLRVSTQAEDPEAPDFFAIIAESELRLLDGNR